MLRLSVCLAAPGNILSGGGFEHPFWVVALANMAVAIHLIGAYQVWTQPLYGAVERYLLRKVPVNFFTHKEVSAQQSSQFLSPADSCGSLLLPAMRMCVPSASFWNQAALLTWGLLILFANRPWPVLLELVVLRLCSLKSTGLQGTTAHAA